MPDEFFRTRMGLRFFEMTVPRIADALERLAGVAERIATALDAPYSTAGCSEEGLTPPVPVDVTIDGPTRSPDQ